jgi:hypothetical protein
MVRASQLSLPNLQPLLLPQSVPRSDQCCLLLVLPAAAQVGDQGARARSPPALDLGPAAVMFPCFFALRARELVS